MSATSHESALAEELYGKVQEYIEPTVEPAAALFVKACCEGALRDVSNEALTLGVFYGSLAQPLYLRGFFACFVGVWFEAGLVKVPLGHQPASNKASTWRDGVRRSSNKTSLQSGNAYPMTTKALLKLEQSLRADLDVTEVCMEKGYYAGINRAMGMLSDVAV